MPGQLNLVRYTTVRLCIVNAIMLSLLKLGRACCSMRENDIMDKTGDIEADRSLVAVADSTSHFQQKATHTEIASSPFRSHT